MQAGDQAEARDYDFTAVIKIGEKWDILPSCFRRHGSKPTCWLSIKTGNFF